MVMDQDRHQFASTANPPNSTSNGHEYVSKSSGGSAGEKTPTDSDDDTPERPGSAPPTLDLTSKSLFAFGAQPSNLFSAEYMNEEQLYHQNYEEFDYVEEKAETHDLNEYVSEHVDTLFVDEPAPPAPEPRYSATQAYLNQPRLRKNSLEMFLLQSPSHALGEQFMNMDLEDEGVMVQRHIRVFHPSAQQQVNPNSYANNGQTSHQGPEKWENANHQRQQGSRRSSAADHQHSHSHGHHGSHGHNRGQQRKPSPPSEMHARHHFNSEAQLHSRHQAPSPPASTAAAHVMHGPPQQPPNAESTHAFHRPPNQHQESSHSEPEAPQPTVAATPTGAPGYPYYIPTFTDGSGMPLSYAAAYSGLVPAGQLHHPVGAVSYHGILPHHVMMPGVVPMQWAPVMMHSQAPLAHHHVAAMAATGYVTPPQIPASNLYPEQHPGASPKPMKMATSKHHPSSRPKYGKYENVAYAPRPATPSTPLGSGGADYKHHSPDSAEEHRMNYEKHQRSEARRRRTSERDFSQEHFPADVGVGDIKGRVFQMSKDQNGCRLLQELLDQGKPELRDAIFIESLDHLAEMMVDPFGNYLFQKLVERCNDQQKTEIVERVGGNLVAAALNLHGTRSVQKVVEVCRKPEQVRHIVNALRKQAVRLCIDSNGNHVIQRALQNMGPEDNNFVFDAVAEACVVVGTHRHGCCVLQRCLDAANPVQKRLIIGQVEKHAMQLMQDPYGNYVVQYVLDTCSPEEAAGVILKPLGHIAHLSVQKFSSNVIEKCLEKASEPVREMYLVEVSSRDSIKHLLQDQYANYVVQRALSVASYEHGMALVHAIKKHLPAMKNTSGGRRITARILKRFPNVDLETLEGAAVPVAPGPPQEVSVLAVNAALGAPSPTASTMVIQTVMTQEASADELMRVAPPLPPGPPTGAAPNVVLVAEPLAQ